tara:strand:+ start:699 stop:1259 length:561 start_codon:yes stop_codon:yes gene_type:complete
MSNGKKQKPKEKTMSDDLTLEIDFTGISAATGGISVLPPGTHTASIDEYARFTDNGSNKLYVYMVTDGLRHRQSWNLTSDGSKSHLMAFLLSAGVPDAKLNGKAKIPFSKTVGRTVYFNYVPPELDANGKAVQGSYPKYTFYTKGRYDKLAAVSNAPKVESNGAGKPVPPPKKEESSSNDFDFLLD